MKVIRSRHNDLLNYFLYPENKLSNVYIKKCRKFLFMNTRKAKNKTKS